MPTSFSISPAFWAADRTTVDGRLSGRATQSPITAAVIVMVMMEMTRSQEIMLLLLVTTPLASFGFAPVFWLHPFYHMGSSDFWREAMHRYTRPNRHKPHRNGKDIKKERITDLEIKLAAQQEDQLDTQNRTFYEYRKKLDELEALCAGTRAAICSKCARKLSRSLSTSHSRITRIMNTWEELQRFPGSLLQERKLEPGQVRALRCSTPAAGVVYCCGAARR